MDLKSLITKMDELSTEKQPIAESVEQTEQLLTESVVQEETGISSGIAQTLLNEFNIKEAPVDPRTQAERDSQMAAVKGAFSDWEQSDLDIANKARDLAVGHRPGQQPPESWATARGPAQTKPAPKIPNLPPKQAPQSKQAPQATQAPKPAAQASQPSGQAIPNPYPPGSPSAEIFDTLSPEDQAWATKGGGKPDLTDEFIRNRMPNKGQPVEKAATQQGAQPADTSGRAEILRQAGTSEQEIKRFKELVAKAKTSATPAAQG